MGSVLLLALSIGILLAGIGACLGAWIAFVRVGQRADQLTAIAARITAQALEAEDKRREEQVRLYTTSDGHCPTCGFTWLAHSDEGDCPVVPEEWEVP